MIQKRISVGKQAEISTTNMENEDCNKAMICFRGGFDFFSERL
jgi:hypothetical protein